MVKGARNRIFRSDARGNLPVKITMNTPTDASVPSLAVIAPDAAASGEARQAFLHASMARHAGIACRVAAPEASWLARQCRASGIDFIPITSGFASGNGGRILSQSLKASPDSACVAALHQAGLDASRVTLHGFDACVAPIRRAHAAHHVLPALAAGLPVVCNPVGVLADLVVDGEQGMLTQRDDSAGLQKALTRMLLDVEEFSRMGRAASAAFQARASMRPASRRYVSLLRKLSVADAVT